MLQCPRVTTLIGFESGIRPSTGEPQPLPEHTSGRSMTDDATSIHFNAADHTYLLQSGTTYRVPVLSATAACSDAEPQFDQRKALACVMREPRKEQYRGLSREQILQKWEDNKNRAAELGTQAHHEIEMMLLGRPFRDIPETRHAIVALQVVSAVCTAEFGCSDVTVLAVEGLLTGCDNELAGSPDLVLKIVPCGRLVIVDWKRSTAHLQNAARAMMGAPLRDCFYSKYHAQINVYAHLLEMAGYEVVAGFLCNVHPDDSVVDNRVVRVPRRPVLARRIVCALMRKLQALCDCDQVHRCELSGKPVRSVCSTSKGVIDTRIAKALGLAGTDVQHSAVWNEIAKAEYNECKGQCCKVVETSYINDVATCISSVDAVMSFVNDQQALNTMEDGSTSVGPRI